MNACLFKCQICWDFETTVGKEFTEHISSQHRVSEAEYEETYESLMLAPSHVECPRCEMSVLHCEKDISEHQVNALNGLGDRVLQALSQFTSVSCMDDSGGNNNRLRFMFRVGSSYSLNLVSRKYFCAFSIVYHCTGVGL